MSDLAWRIAQLSPEKRELLEQLLGAKRQAARAYRAPRTESECVLVQIWAEVFGLADIGIDDDFFDLGGDSILSIQIIAKARQRGLRLTARELFDKRSIGALADGLAVNLHSCGTDEQDVDDCVTTAAADEMRPEWLHRHLTATQIDVHEIEDVFPLSPIQQGMLYHILAEPEHPLYFEQTSCTLRGDLDVPAFERAWQAAVSKHPMLRTGFLWRDLPEPVQVVHKSADVSLRHLDWSALPYAQQQAAYAELLQLDRTTRFDLATPPQMRLTLITVGSGVHWLIWSSYHLILDAWSLAAVVRDVFTHYSVGAAATAPDNRGSYKQYVAWLKSRDLTAAQSFWRARLEGCQPPAAISGLPPSTGAVAGIAQRELELTAADTVRIYDSLRAAHLTVGTAIQAAWSVLLHRMCGTREVLFGLVVSGRPAELAQSQSIVGPFINTLPVRIELDGSMIVRKWLAAVQQAQLAAAEFDFVPPVLMKRWSGRAQDQPLFETVLVVLNVVDLRREQINGLSVEDVRATGYSNYPLVIRATPGTVLKLEVLYHTARCTPAFAEHVLTSLQSVLTGMIGRLDASLSALMEVAHAVSSARHTAAECAAEARSLGTALPRIVKLTRGELVSTDYLRSAGQTLPIVRPSRGTLDAAAWVEGNSASLSERLLLDGSVLLRGFQLARLAAFQDLAQAMCPQLLAYRDRSTPRTLLHGQVYSSTEYPATETIALHNEFSYALQWPMKIFFHCVEAAVRGGETPIADCRLVFDRLDPLVRQRFIDKKVLYVRNYGQGIDLSWQEAFQTQSRREVEEYCRGAQIEIEWHGRERLRTRQLREAVAIHPTSGDWLWFNQAHLFHPTNLHPAVQEDLLQSVSEDDLPRNCYFGDGSPIEATDLAAVRASYRAAELVFPWEPGDVLLLDNMRVAHGRRPFSGERKVVVCMAEPHAAHRRP